ncbi:MAG: hypothetical protein ACE5NA_05710, partial [Nitrospiraceae bacterium]
KMPWPWQVWLLVLVTANFVAPLLWLDRPEAQFTLAAAIGGLVLMTMLTGLTGFTRLVGLGHLPWIPLLIYLWTRLDQAPAEDPFGMWIRSVIVLNAVSLLIDAVDVGRFIAGDRQETVQGL